ncbi:ABC transporter permease [Arsenicicoccus sp. oral taxon 190]|nr:ABC transporter permease [Arsenicicoccus sp. oral taxon 190]
MRVVPALTLLLVSVVCAAAFLWPFVTTSPAVLAHAHDAPWVFAALLGLLALVCLAEVTSEGLDAKTVAVMGVLCAAGGGLRVLSAGTAGLEPMFFLLVLAGAVLGPAPGFVVGALSLLTGALLTGAIGPWVPFQMIACGWVALVAGLLPIARLGVRARCAVLGLYGLVAGLAYGLVMNLWFWPFLATTLAPQGAGFVPGADVATNVSHYLTFYVLTSLGWDVPRGVLTAVLVWLAGPATDRVLRRAVRRARFDATATFLPDPQEPR